MGVIRMVWVFPRWLLAGPAVLAAENLDQLGAGRRSAIGSECQFLSSIGRIAHKTSRTAIGAIGGHHFDLCSFGMFAGYILCPFSTRLALS